MRLMMHLYLSHPARVVAWPPPTGAAAAFAPVGPCFLGGTREGTELADTGAWLFHWHRFIDHIAFGKDVESFFSNL